jgi:hypothetical protein
MDAENQSQQPSSQKSKVSSQTDPVEAEHVRAVLAHITNNKTVSTQQQQQRQVPAAAFAKKPEAPKVVAPVVKSAEPASHKKQQQPPAPVPLKSDVAVSENKKAALPVAASAPVPAIAPSSSRPPTRATNQKASRTTRAAVGSAGTRARDPPRVRAPITKKAAAAAKKQQPQRSKPQITVAKSPFLRSKQRSVTHRQQAKTTEELEMEKVEKAKQEVAALRRRNARTVGPALQGRTAAPPRPGPKRSPTGPVKEFNLRTAKRQRVHGMETRHQGAPASGVAPSPWKSTAQRVAEFTTGVATRQTNQRQRPVPRGGRQQQQQKGRAELTVPRTPRFATKTRARASRFKPTEELEAEKAIAEAQAVKVRQKKETERANNTVAPAARRRSERRPLTEFKPFSFATDVRAAQRSTRPAAELPVFVFGAEENGPVTRSRAHVVSTTAPYAAAAAPRSARRELTAVQQHQQYQQAIEEEEYHCHQQRPGSGNNNELFSAGAASNAARRGRTTAGPMQLGRLGGAVRVLRQEQEEQPSSNNDGDDDDCCTEEQDGMQAIIRAGATLGMDRTTLHNPLFHAS